MQVFTNEFLQVVKEEKVPLEFFAWLLKLHRIVFDKNLDFSDLRRFGTVPERSKAQYALVDAYYDFLKNENWQAALDNSEDEGGEGGKGANKNKNNNSDHKNNNTTNNNILAVVRSDFPSPKVVVRHIGQGKGRGLFATRLIKKGEVILTERSIVELRAEDQGVRAEWGFWKMFSSLPETKQKQFLDLHDRDLNVNKNMNESERRKDAFSVWKTNRFGSSRSHTDAFEQVQIDERQSVYYWTSFSNHECSPNAGKYFDGDFDDLADSQEQKLKAQRHGLQRWERKSDFFFFPSFPSTPAILSVNKLKFYRY